jgi:hypothetical protein
MAQTFKITDGDFTKDSLKRLNTVTGIDIVRQSIRETILNSLSPELVSEADDNFLDLTEGLLTLRIIAMIERLQRIFNETNVQRDGSERIREIEVVAVKRSRLDPRNVKFWARILTVSGSPEEFLGEV